MRATKVLLCAKCSAIKLYNEHSTESFWEPLSQREKEAIETIQSSAALTVLFGKVNTSLAYCDDCRLEPPEN